MKQKISAVVAGFVVQMAGLFLIHSVWLKQDYVDYASLWRSQQEATLRVWAMLLAGLIYVVCAAWNQNHGLDRASASAFFPPWWPLSMAL